MKVLGLIPARGGSKRVKRKNLRLLAGKHLIVYTLDAALQTEAIDRLVVSTDDAEIAEVARNHGVDVPFLRPSYLAGDSIPDQPVFRHAVDWLMEHEGFEPDIILNLRPTTPFKTPEIITRVVRTMTETGADIVRTVTRVEGVNHPYWMYRLSDDGCAMPVIEHVDIKDYYQSQLLPPVYRINGVVDAFRTHVVRSGEMLSNSNMTGVVIPAENSIDIDDEFDFKVCELLMEAI